MKPPKQSLSAYVREAVQRDIMRRKLRDAAERYQAFLDDHPEEKIDMERWESAPLENKPRKSQ